MFKTGWAIAALMIAMLSCKNGEEEKEKEKEQTSSQSLSDFFKKGSLPYQLTDTGLSKASDTTSLPPAVVSPLAGDSTLKKYFGAARVKYTALHKLTSKEKDAYYFIKASASTKKAAILLVMDKDDAFGAAYPFLLPDADPSTTQSTTLDKNFTITKSISQRSADGLTAEGKDVVAYDAASKSFSLIMQDALNDVPAELVNPIDTFRRTHALAGDYYGSKKNLVAIRDGRYPNQLLVYIHTENEAGDCKGELKGEFLLTTAKTATYRLGGDPCVLGLAFSGNSVSIKEESGCGNHRGLDCPLNGTFTRKKPQPQKVPAKKTKRK